MMGLELELLFLYPVESGTNFGQAMPSLDMPCCYSFGRTIDIVRVAFDVS